MVNIPRNIDSNFVTNLNLIKICIKLTEYKETTFDEIISLKIIDKVNILTANEQNDSTVFVEYVIELFYHLMVKINEFKKTLSSNMDKEEFKVINILNLEIYF
jgi:hypothetical protein